MAESNAESVSLAPGATGKLVARNALLLTLSQALTIPAAVLVNALTARYLGADIFGYLYLAGTFTGFGYVALSWGHEGVLPAMVAQNHRIAGELLGSALAWRAATSLLIYAVMAGICHFLGYGSELQWALGLSFIAAILTSCAAACKDTIRGFERADIPALAHVGQQFLGTALVVPVLLLGGRMRALLCVAIATLGLVLLWLIRKLPSVGVLRLTVARSAIKALFVGGSPFVVFALAMSAQPLIDAAYLSKLGSVAAVGWYAVARKLIGLLAFPATALIGALYPTLCRLWAEDQDEYRRVARGSLQSVLLLAMPVTLGCALYPDIGITIFSKESFGPAADDLRILSGFLFLTYLTMPVGTCVLSAGKQRAWSLVQTLCVIVSLVLDPLLIPWFERNYGNGGLGPCTAALISELLVITLGFWLMPAGIFDARLRRTSLFCLLSGAAMALVAWLLRSLNPFLAAPVASLSYGVALLLTGEITRSDVAKVLGAIRYKFGRLRARLATSSHS